MRARPEVEQLKAYSAPLEGRRNLLRLDFNENTMGPSPRVAEAIREYPSDQIAIYPEYDGLREALIANLESSPAGLACALTSAHVGVFNGVDAAIHAVIHAYGAAGDTLLTTSPTFGYYAPCAGMQGMAVEAVPHEMPGFAFPMEAIRSALLRTPRILMVCNPNNPTGTRLPADQVLDLATAAPETLVVVDELYEAFTGDSVLPSIDFREVPNLLVLRSLAKTAGLAGLRIGFALGHPDVVDRVGRVTGPYDVNSLAVTAAMAALNDQPYTDAYVEEVLRARDWIVSVLTRQRVIHHVAGGNYLLVWPRRSAQLVDAKLREAGILVRSMAGKPQIDGSLRVSIGTTEQMQRFWLAYQAIDSGL
ncbi:histidinol-phosphate aminotransferase [Synechococcus sp. WH 8020]|uniref:pyridoxal phosphate-dependent aminotransferase n=1 Tax=Synechococcus sp. (strain WH8020) TaxID=32052 RepID=UPI0006527DB1|nr:histidinol-phosphate transaminase [Synechococcus sp. WH 8020]AKN62355.1 histidinol-phosphate aminotransferase [Synechococcus sp. WH 8020]